MTRSRPSAELAYSPTGPSGSSSPAPSLAAGVSGYTLPVENATRRAARYRSAQIAGTMVFIAHVVAGVPEVPNFCPAMKMTLGASGSTATASRSSKSQAMVSTPAAPSARATLGDENRDTAKTRRPSPTCAAARAAMRATVGPILPPAPRTTMSPGQLRNASTVSARGAESISSSSVSVTTARARNAACLTWVAVSIVVDEHEVARGEIDGRGPVFAYLDRQRHASTLYWRVELVVRQQLPRPVGRTV